MKFITSAFIFTSMLASAFYLTTEKTPVTSAPVVMEPPQASSLGQVTCNDAEVCFFGNTLDSPSTLKATKRKPILLAPSKEIVIPDILVDANGNEIHLGAEIGGMATMKLSSEETQFTTVEQPRGSHQGPTDEEWLINPQEQINQPKQVNQLRIAEKAKFIKALKTQHPKIKDSDIVVQYDKLGKPKITAWGHRRIPRYAKDGTVTFPYKGLWPKRGLTDKEIEAKKAAAAAAKWQVEEAARNVLKGRLIEAFMHQYPDTKRSDIHISYNKMREHQFSVNGVRRIPQIAADGKITFPYKGPLPQKK